jgi:hypothetical protein
VISTKDHLLAELAKGRTVALFCGMDSTPAAQKHRWAIAETGETVSSRAVRGASPELEVIQRDICGEPMQYGPGGAV